MDATDKTTSASAMLEAYTKLLPVPDENDEEEFIQATVGAVGAVVTACANVWDRALTGDVRQKIGWEFYRAMVKPNNKFGLRMQDFDHLLNPQCRDEFTTIPRQVWEKLKDHASNLLDCDDGKMTDAQVMHLEGIAVGIVPFGLEVK